jgi:hypothetical protein
MLRSLNAGSSYDGKPVRCHGNVYLNKQLTIPRKCGIFYFLTQYEEFDYAHSMGQKPSSEVHRSSTGQKMPSLFISLFSLNRKVRLMRSPLCLFLCVSHVQLLNQLVDFHDIQQGSQAIEGDLDAVPFNPIAATIQKWRCSNF